MMKSAMWLTAIFLLLPWSTPVFSLNGDSPQQESRLQHQELEMKLDSFSRALEFMEAEVSRLSEENQECKLANERMAKDLKLANDVMANEFKQDIKMMASEFKQDIEMMANDFKHADKMMANDFKQTIERMANDFKHADKEMANEFTLANKKMAADTQQLKSAFHSRINGIEDSVLCLQKLDIQPRLEKAETSLSSAHARLQTAENSLQKAESVQNLDVLPRLKKAETSLKSAETRLEKAEKALQKAESVQNFNVLPRLKESETSKKLAETRLEKAENSLRGVQSETLDLMEWKRELDRERNKLRNETKNWVSTESCRTLLESGHTAPGYYWVDGPGGTNYHLVKCNMNLDPTDPAFQISTSAKLSEYPVAFDFYDNSTAFGEKNVPVPYGQFRINDGNGMTNDGTFTVPLDGVYLLSFTAQSMPGDWNTYIKITVDGRMVSRAQLYSQPNNFSETGTIHVLLVLKKNQKVQSQVYLGRIYMSHTRFMGVLLYPL